MCEIIMNLIKDNHKRQRDKQTSGC